MSNLSLQFPHINPLINCKRPVLCIEINPPHGTDLESLYAKYDNQLSVADYINVTDSALAKMRPAALPFASLLKQRYGLEPLVNLSCRDRNVIGLQGDLLAGWMLGIRSIVALTGDAVTIGDHPEAKGVFEINSIGLLNMINGLNNGVSLSGKELIGSTNFICGVVVNPNVRNVHAELRRLSKKKAAGAQYALSQPVFDAQLATEFLEQCRSVEIPILLGLVPFKTAKSLLGMTTIPGMKIPETLAIQARSNENQDLSELSLQLCLSIVEATKNLVTGFHIISGATPKLALRLLHLVRDQLTTRVMDKSSLQDGA